MSLLKQEIKLVGSKGRQDAIALFDSGATYSFIRRDIAEAVALIEKLPEPMVFETAKENEYITIDERIVTNFYIDIYRLSDEFLVSNIITEAVIIGVHTMQKWRLKLDFEHDEVIVDPYVTRLMLK
ncbi:MAG: hypothetical protein O7E52_23205 [Candidatus Poribacteria bacterium]|nr:hypothetical protein [Candidatus Poribacteria bacterium]